ncbi:hypothetical protein FNV43_RR07226 [Rhamnella rubrinervis]|uniref:Uncharacterized protein n=1 Tax=Rhamnella rubrinervis TaxID=2594499 RepID=A0A8K0HEW2_9ROSA|nr:hypothetical protein FNV43_RR07226 [Rhamnella rubrinervis]
MPGNLHSGWIGPFVITNVLSHGVVEIQSPDIWKAYDLRRGRNKGGVTQAPNSFLEVTPEALSRDSTISPSIRLLNFSWFSPLFNSPIEEFTSLRFWLVNCAFSLRNWMCWSMAFVFQWNCVEGIPLVYVILFRIQSNRLIQEGKVSCYPLLVQGLAFFVVDMIGEDISRCGLLMCLPRLTFMMRYVRNDEEEHLSPASPRCPLLWCTVHLSRFITAFYIAASRIFVLVWRLADGWRLGCSFPAFMLFECFPPPTSVCTTFGLCNCFLLFLFLSSCFPQCGHYDLGGEGSV